MNREKLTDTIDFLYERVIKSLPISNKDIESRYLYGTVRQAMAMSGLIIKIKGEWLVNDAEVRFDTIIKKCVELREKYKNAQKKRVDHVNKKVFASDITGKSIIDRPNLFTPASFADKEIDLCMLSTNQLCNELKRRGYVGKLSKSNEIVL